MQYVIIAVLTIVFAFLVWNRWFRKTETPTVTPVGRYITDEDLEAFLKEYSLQFLNMGIQLGRQGRVIMPQEDGSIFVGWNHDGYFTHTSTIDIEGNVTQMPKHFANNIIPVEPETVPELSDYGIG